MNKKLSLIMWSSSFLIECSLHSAKLLGTPKNREWETAGQKCIVFNLATIILINKGKRRGGARKIGNAKGRSRVQCETMTTLWVAANQTEFLSAWRPNGPVNRVVTKPRTLKLSGHHRNENATCPIYEWQRNILVDPSIGTSEHARNAIVPN